MQLEDGLQTLHESTSDCVGSTHPLLTDELRHIKTPMGAEIVGSSNPHLHRKKTQPGQPSNGEVILPSLPMPASLTRLGTTGEVDSPTDDEDVTDSFGTLALSEASGKAEFFGTQAGAQFLLGVSIDIPGGGIHTLIVLT